MKLTKAFYMAMTEVTQAQWKTLMGTSPWSGEEYAREGAIHAASYISWNNATEFCRKMSAKTAKAVRLPTEAEWEYACRAGSTTAYHFGNDASQLHRYAWHDKNASDKGEKYAHAVGQKRPNAWGLYDMPGNVWEWCQDWYEKRYLSTPQTDPKGPAGGSSRVLRGGSWLLFVVRCRSAGRSAGGPDDAHHDAGFRVVVSASAGLD